MKINCNLEELELMGVYSIINLVNNKMYIGSTRTSFRIRFIHHKNKLIKGTHKNSYMQHAFNKYGTDKFEFRIIEIC